MNQHAATGEHSRLTISRTTKDLSGLELAMPLLVLKIDGPDFRVDRHMLDRMGDWLDNGLPSLRGEEQFVQLAPRPDTSLADERTRLLRDEITKVLIAKGVRACVGPACAFFEIIQGGKRVKYLYQSFGMKGPKEQGQAGGTSKLLSEVIATTASNFSNWLQPKKRLVWRTLPVIDYDDEFGFASFFRCVQVDGDGEELQIIFGFE